MLKRLLRSLSFIINSPKTGDQFFGESQDHITGSLESALHGLNALNGGVSFYFHGKDTYRLTVVSTAMPYYILQAAVLVKPIEPTKYFEWSERIQRRRISKDKFKEMFLQGKIRRAN